MTRSTVVALAILATSLALVSLACDGEDDVDGPLDRDGDGFDETVDCDDLHAWIYPGAAEICDGVDDDCDGVIPGDEIDDDGDGIRECEGDCDDTDPANTLGGTEVCDGIDNDCDGVIDNGDADGDGYDVCEDCDDGDERIHPGATERCNGLDDDCDGTVPADEADADGDGDRVCAGDCDDGDATLNLDDADGDGFDTCDGDCDDGDDAVYPGAPDVCDGVPDNDCDGAVDDQERDDDGDGMTECEGDCDDTDPNTTGADADGDGIGACGGDCDDQDPTTYPGATELCDGIDNDCDGSLPPEEADADGDGQPECAGDCDDADPNTYSGATEVCDGVADNSCDGVDDPNESDDDGDGSSECDGDCDDADAAVGPQATEICGDGIDNDCDGTANGCSIEGVLALATADAVLTGTAGGDEASYRALSAGDLDGDGVGDVAVGAAGYDGAFPGAGGAFVVLGPLTGSTGLAASDAIVTGEAAADAAGTAVALDGDCDGDGRDDLLVGAPGESTAGAGAGAAYLAAGPLLGTSSLAAATAKLTGEQAGDEAGRAVALIPDLDGDGDDEILVGAPSADAGGGNAGAAYLVRGPVSGTTSLSAAGAAITGETFNESVGVAVAGGDADGDGDGDMLIGATGRGSGAGAALLVYGPVSGTVTSSGADALLTGENAGDRAGVSVALGDVNGDGADDLLIGADGSDAAGADSGIAYLVLGPVWGTVPLSTADARLEGPSSGAGAGVAVASACDVDASGIGDLLVGAPGAGGTQGAAYLLYGPVAGTVDLGLADAVLEGSAGIEAGDAVWCADVNDDGVDDVLVGAAFDDAAGADAGAVYVLLGGAI